MRKFRTVGIFVPHILITYLDSRDLIIREYTTVSTQSVSKNSVIEHLTEMKNETSRVTRGGGCLHVTPTSSWRWKEEQKEIQGLPNYKTKPNVRGIPKTRAFPGDGLVSADENQSLVANA